MRHNLIFIEHSQGAALRDGPFLATAALFLADVHLIHCTQNALQRANNKHAPFGFYVNRA